MNTVITFNPDSCHIVCLPQVILTDLALGLEFLANNFTGRGVYSWSADRIKGDTDECIISGSALVASGPTQISPVMKLRDAILQKVIPYRIPENQLFTYNNTHIKAITAPDGQNRRLLTGIKANPDGWTETIIEAKDIDTDQQLGVFSYGFADMATGLFNLGVRHIKYQFSQASAQLYFKHMLDDVTLLKFFQSEGQDYPIRSCVSKLP